MNSTEKPGRRYRKIATAIAIAIILAFVTLLIVGGSPKFTTSALIQFDWRESTGFDNISVQWPNRGIVYEQIIILQAKRYIASEARNAGWTEAQGTLPVRTVAWIYVSG